MDDNPGISLFANGGINVENALQNQEEVEDIEDQKRRQEEIQNLLTVAMDEFNYDDQSTINSSTNISVEESYPNRLTIEQKYKDVSFNDQLKVLYEVRVREVKSLSEQLEKLKSEVAQQKELASKTKLLLEAEQDKAQISSQQSQVLLVSKSEEITKLKNELDQLNSNMKHFEEVIIKLNSEKDACEHSNKELIEQLAIMHRGITTNTISDKEFQEQHHSEVTRLHSLIDTAHMKLYRKEKECKELEHNLKVISQEKNDIVAEKYGTINKLTENLESAQQQCQELLHLVQTLSQENKSLKNNTASELTQSIKTMGLNDKTEIIKALQREIEKAKDEKSKQQIEFDKLQQTCAEISEKCNIMEHQIEQYMSEIVLRSSQNEKLQNILKKYDIELKELKNELSDYRKIQDEKLILEEKVNILQNRIENMDNKDFTERSVQVSQFAESLNEFEKEENLKLQADLEVVSSELQTLKLELVDKEDQISKLTKTIGLEKERENLIQTLQEKAAKFEKTLADKQNKLECVSTGTNTVEMQGNEEFFQAKYEADIIQKEIQIRIELKSVFDAKLKKIENDLYRKLTEQNGKKCAYCENILQKFNQMELISQKQYEEINNVKHQRQQDKEAVAKLLEDWKDKFYQLEFENREITNKYVQLKNICDEMSLKLKIREVGDAKLYEVIKRECEETIKLWNTHTQEKLQKYTTVQKNKIQQTWEKIEESSKNIDREIYAIEMRYLRKKQTVEAGQKNN